MGGLIQMPPLVAARYKNYLAAYKAKTGKEPGPSERTEAFICANKGDRLPHWMK